eukprot:4474040-Prymnesium_polylepis.1
MTATPPSTGAHHLHPWAQSALPFTRPVTLLLTVTSAALGQPGSSQQHSAEATAGAAAPGDADDSDEYGETPRSPSDGHLREAGATPPHSP